MENPFGRALFALGFVREDQAGVRPSLAIAASPRIENRLVNLPAFPAIWYKGALLLVPVSSFRNSGAFPGVWRAVGCVRGRAVLDQKDG